MSAMGSMRFVPMAPELFGLLPLPAAFRDCNLHDLPLVQAAVCAAPNFALALLDEGRVMAAGGVVQLWPGRGSVWLLPGTWMTLRHWGMVLARCTAELRRLEAGGMRRIECTVLTGEAKRMRWAGRLGFGVESIMRRYGPDGSDHAMMVRL